jgi:hypothetical protein
MSVEDMAKWRELLRVIKEEEVKERESLQTYRTKLDAMIQKQGGVFPEYDEERMEDMNIDDWRGLAMRLTCSLHNCMWAINLLEVADCDDAKKERAVDALGEGMLVLNEANKVVPLEDEE